MVFLICLEILKDRKRMMRVLELQFLFFFFASPVGQVRIGADNRKIQNSFHVSFRAEFSFFFCL